MMKYLNSHLRLIQLLLFVLLFASAELGVRLFFQDNTAMFPPSEVLLKMPELLNCVLPNNSGFLFNAGVTCRRAAVGFLLCAILGVACGLVLGKFDGVYRVLQPFIDFMRPIPSSALILPVLVILKETEWSYMFVIVFGAIWPVLINTTQALRKEDFSSYAATTQLALTRSAMVLRVLIPKVTPEVVSGLKVSMSICVIITVTVELIASPRHGLGVLMKFIENGGDLRLLYCTFLAICGIGFVLNRLIEFILSKLRWGTVYSN